MSRLPGKIGIPRIDRIARMVKNDIIFQVKHGFYGAYVLVAALYMVFLSMIPADYRGTAVVLILFIDTSALGFFFLGGLVLLEKGQRIYQGLFISPLRVGEFIAARVISLTVLSLAMSLLVVLGGRTVPRRPDLLLAGIALSSIFFILAGFPFAARSRNVNTYFISAMGVLSPFFLPLLPFFGLFRFSLLNLLPTAAALTLLSGAYEGASPESVAGALAVFAVWIAGFGIWAYKWFFRYVAYTAGGEA